MNNYYKKYLKYKKKYLELKGGGLTYEEEKKLLVKDELTSDEYYRFVQKSDQIPATFEQVKQKIRDGDKFINKIRYIKKTKTDLINQIEKDTKVVEEQEVDTLLAKDELTDAEYKLVKQYDKDPNTEYKSHSKSIQTGNNEWTDEIYWKSPKLIKEEAVANNIEVDTLLAKDKLTDFEYNKALKPVGYEQFKESLGPYQGTETYWKSPKLIKEEAVAKASDDKKKKEEAEENAKKDVITNNEYMSLSYEHKQLFSKEYYMNAQILKSNPDYYYAHVRIDSPIHKEITDAEQFITEYTCACTCDKRNNPKCKCTCNKKIV